MRSLFLFAVLLLTASLTYAQSEKPSTTKQNQTTNAKQLSKTQQEILDLMVRWDKAVSTRDITTFDQLTANDAHLINPFGRHTKAEQLAGYRQAEAAKAPIPQIKSTPDNIEISIFGDTAILTANVSVKGTADGDTIDQYLAATAVWMKRNGKWQLVALTNTPIQRTSITQ